MSHISVHSERVIDASPEEIFSALADYENKRSRILTPNFLNYRVEKGGQGSGTVISYVLQAAGRERSYQMYVDEPQRGRLLAERDSHSSLVTRWSVQPVDGSQSSLVIVESDWDGSGGVGGFFERTFAPLGLRRIYHDMLIALALLVQTPEQNRQIMLLDKKNRKPGAGLALVIVGSLLAVVLGLNYLRKQQQSNLPG
jgi:hypothetical protein